MSLSLLSLFLFFMAFVKLENRRVGYEFIGLVQQEKSLRVRTQKRGVRLAKMMGPKRLRLLATQQLPLRKAHPQQIIQLTRGGMALKFP